MHETKLHRQIKQIAPAEGFLAAYKDEETGEGSKLPLTCFALTHFTEFGASGEPVDSGEAVEGMLGSGLFAEDQPGFLGYTRNRDATVIDNL